MHRDRNGMRGAREPEENESGRQKKSLESQNRMNSKVLFLVFVFLGIKTFPKLNKTIRNEFPIKFYIGICVVDLLS